MDTDIKTIKALADHRVEVVLADGRAGVFDLRPYLDRPGMMALKDPAYFRQVQVLFGAATWPGGEDIAPATLAAGMTALQAA